MGKRIVGWDDAKIHVSAEALIRDQRFRGNKGILESGRRATFAPCFGSISTG
jgi:hypothetical protein